MALSYTQVLDRYDRARAFGDTRSLPEYAKGLNDLYDTQDFSAGLRDGPWTRFSARADQFLGNTVGQVTAPIGEAFGGAFGNPEAGRRVGEGLPRALLQSAPMYALGPEAGVPATIAALAGTGALFGAQTYADTGSPKAALYSGLTAAALPQVGRFAGNLGARVFGGSRVAGELGGNAFNEVLPETGADAFRVGAGRLLGSQGAQIGAQLGSQIAQNRALGGDESWSDALTSPDFWLNQVPFTVYDAVHAARTSVPTAESVRPQLTQPQREVPKTEYVPPPAAPEQQAQLDSLLDGFRAVQGDPNATPEDRAAALRAVVNHTFEAPSQVEEPVPQPEPTVAIQGQADKIGNGNYRVLVTGHNDIVNGPKVGSTVFVNGVEPDANGVFHAKPSQVRTATFGLKPESVLDPSLNPVIPPRADGVLPTESGAEPTIDNSAIERPATQALGLNPEASVHDRGTPFGDVFANVPKLTNADVEGLTALNVKPEDLAKATPDITPALKQHVATFELAKQTETSAREAATSVPTKAEEWVALTHPKQDVNTEVTPVLTNARWDGDTTITMSFDAAHGIPTPKQVEETFAKNGFKVSATQFKTNLVTATQGKINYRLDVLEDTPTGNVRNSKKQAQAAYQSLFGSLDPINEKSLQQLSAGLADRFGAAWNFGAQKMGIDPKVVIESHMERGATPTQAVESARLQTQTPIVDESVVEQNVAHDLVHKTVSAQEQNEYGGAILDEHGNRRRWRNPAQADQWLETTYRAEHPEDKRAFQTRNDNRGFYYLAPKENVKVAYDTNAEGQGMENVLSDGHEPTLSEAGAEYNAAAIDAQQANLNKELQEAEVAQTPVEIRPDISRQSVLDNLNVAARNPEAFAEFVDPDIIEDSPQNLVAKAQIALTQGTEGLAKVNEALKARGIEPFKNEREMTTQMKELMRGAAMFQDRHRNVALGSVVPGDATALPTGTLDSVSNLAAHIASRKEMGVVADLMDAMVKSGILPKDTVIEQPGTPDHDPLGFWMQQGVGDLVPSRLNIPSFPEGVNDTFWYRQAAHEITHLSEEALAQRTDPAAMEYRTQRDAVLEALRDSNAVPKKVRSVVAKLVKDGAYAKMLANTLSPDDLRAQILSGVGKENRGYFSYVYGMLDPREMSATLFSDPKLVAIADTTSMKKGIIDSALTWLSKVFGRAVGSSDPTALSTMLKSYDNYLTGGIMRKVYNGANFVRDGLVAQGVRPDALASRMQTVDRMFARGTLDASVAGYQREANAGILPATANEGPIEPGVVDALRAPEASAPYDATMGLLANQLPVHQDLLWRMSQDLDLTDKLVKAVKSGEVPGSLPPNVESNLALSRAKVNSMRKAMQKQALALARWNKLDQFDPQGWEASVADGLTQKIRSIEPPDEVPDAAEYRKLAGIERLEGGGVNWLQKTFMMTQYLKDVVPATRGVIDNVFRQQGDANQRMAELRLSHSYNPKTGEVGDLGVRKENERVAASPAMTQAYSDIARWQNLEGQMQGVDYKDPTIVKLLSRFNEKDRDAIRQLVESQRNRHHVWADIELPNTYSKINRDYTADLVASRSPGMQPVMAQKFATDLYNALALSVDPTKGATGVELLRQLSTQVTPETYIAALKHAHGLSEMTAQFIKDVRENPGWSSEQRLGKDKLFMLNRDGQTYAPEGTRDELNKLRLEKESKGYTFLDYVTADDKNNYSTGMKPGFLKQLEDLDNKNFQLVSEALRDLPDVAAQVLPRMNRAGDMRSAINAGTPMPKVARNFVEGRETINMIQNSELFYMRMNNYLKNKATRAEGQLYMNAPEIQGNRQLSDMMQQHIDSFTTPDNPLATKLVKATTFYKLAFDFGNALLESTQNLTTGMTGLIAETGSVSDAFGLWGKAVKEIIQHEKSGKWSNPELQNFMDLATARGDDLSAVWSDISDGDVSNVMDALGAKGPGHFLKVGSKNFSNFFSRYNNRIGMIAGREIALEKGMQGQDVYDFAADVKNKGTFTGGKAQRGIGFFGIKTRAVPQLMNALQSYSVGWFSQMARNYKLGFGKPPEGLSPTQRLGAKKAFMYGIMAQAALAGALGLPGVGQGLALLGQATDTDPKGWLRQHLATLFDEDQEAGGVLTSLALRGVGSAGLPFDPSGRASVSIPFLGVDAYKGFDVSNLGGAATSTVSDFAKGLLGLMHGDPTGGGALLPNVLKRPYQLWQGEGDIRDARGGLQVQLSPAERFAMAVGITPSRVQTERDTSEALKKANLAAERQQSAFVDSLAQQVRQGNTAQVQQALIQYVKDHPDANAKALVQAVAGRVEAQTVPYDWRRDLNPGVQLAGLTSPQPSSELQRRQVRQGVEQSLGIPSYANPTADYRAALMDQMLDSNPTLQRQSARRAVSGTPPARTPYSWLNN